MPKLAGICGDLRANLGIERTQATRQCQRRFLNPKFAPGLAAKYVRTSGSRHWWRSKSRRGGGGRRLRRRYLAVMYTRLFGTARGRPVAPDPPVTQMGSTETRDGPAGDEVRR